MQEYWDSTPAEILLRYDYHNKVSEQKRSDTMALEYINAYLQRMDHKKFPSFKEYERDFIGIKSIQESKPKPTTRVENLGYYMKMACDKGLKPPLSMKEVS